MKTITAEHKLAMIGLLVNGFVNTNASKNVIQEVSNMQHCMIDNLITVNNNDDFYNMLYVFSYICDMLEQNMGNYRMIIINNTLRLNIPEEAKIRLIEERNDLYCSINKKLSDKDKWEIAQCLRILIRLINYYELHTIEEK
jgi:hypothetical protein